MFLLPIIFFTSLGICSIPKLSTYVTALLFTYNTIQRVPISEYPSRFSTYAPSSILSGKLSLL